MRPDLSYNAIIKWRVMKYPVPLLEYSLSPLGYSCEYWSDSTEYPWETASTSDIGAEISFSAVLHNLFSNYDSLLLSCSFLHLCAFFQGCKGNGDWGASWSSAPLFASCHGLCHWFPSLLSSQNVSTGLKEAWVVLCSCYGKLGRPLHSQLFLLMQSRC